MIFQNSINKEIKLALVLVALIKFPFVFHGNWSGENFFTPYMTDETYFMSPILSVLQSEAGYGYSQIKGILGGYPPLLYNILLPFSFIIFKIVSFVTVDLNMIDLLKVIYYSCRSLVLLVSLIGSYFFVKLFSDIIKSKIFQIVLIVFLNFNSLFFLYSRYIKLDVLVWAVGSISLYYGYLFFKNHNDSGYIKFYAFATLSLCLNYSGYIYFLIFLIVGFCIQMGNRKKMLRHIGLVVFVAPLLFLFVNFEMIANFRENFNYIFKVFVTFFDTNKATQIIGSPFLYSINGYSSFQFYMDYFEHFLIFPVLLLGSMIVFFIKCSNNYFRIVAFVFILFFIHISFADYRTDRLLLPVFLFSTVSVIFSIYTIFEICKNKRIKLFIIVSMLILLGIPLTKTFYLSKALLSRDTRQELYIYLQEEIPAYSNISFLHMSIFGPKTTHQYLISKNYNSFSMKEILLTAQKNEYGLLSDIKGFFIISAVDFDIIKEFSNTKYYSNQNRMLNQLVSRSQLVKKIDKINYDSQPFGPTKMIGNSLYGIHNPPLLVYKTNNAFDHKVDHLFSRNPSDIIVEPKAKEIPIDLKQLGFDFLLKVSNKSFDKDLVTMAHSKEVLNNGEEVSKLNIVNKSDIPIVLFTKYQGVDKKGKNLVYGFGDKVLEGCRFRFSVWVKTTKKKSVAIGFYRGNSGNVIWGRSNMGTDESKYEYLYCYGEFDKKYSLNGNIRIKMEPDSSIEIINPMFVVFEK